MIELKTSSGPTTHTVNACFEGKYFGEEPKVAFESSNSTVVVPEDE